MKQKARRKLKSDLKVAISNKNYKKGIDTINDFLDNHSGLKDNEWILYQQGFLYDHLALEKEGRTKIDLEEKALQFYKKIINKNPDSIKGLWGIARVYWHRGDEKALDYAKRSYRVYKKKTGSESFSNEVALVYEKLGKYDKAEKWFLKGLDEIEKNDELKPMYANIIQFYKDKGDNEKAKKYAKKLNIWLKSQPYQFRSSKSGEELLKLVSEFI